MKIKYIVDATSDISEEYAKKNDVHVLKFPITFSNGVSRDDLSVEEFYKLLEETNEVPKTSQPPITELEETFRSYINDYDAILYITLSSLSSGTFNSANMAKNNILEEFPDAKIEIVDSRAFSLFIIYMLDEAIRLNNEGKSLEEIIEGIKDCRRHLDVCVVVDTLKYLEKNGRINKASLIAGTLLDLKPVLSVRGGLMECIDKFRGSKTVFSKMVKKVKTMDIDLENPCFSLVDSNARDRSNQLFEILKENFGDISLRYQSSLSPTITTHIGPGTVAVFFRTVNPQKVYDED